MFDPSITRAGASKPSKGSRPRAGRPRRGTEVERRQQLLAAATQVFLRDGYGGSSIDKVAREAGVSTRTIYERFKNKAELLGAVFTRLVDRDVVGVLSLEELDRLDLRQGLMQIGQVLMGRASNPEAAALFRICVAEARRFPELAAKLRENGKVRVEDAIARYFRHQIRRGAMALANPERAAGLFMHMVCAELKERLLLGSLDDLNNYDPTLHLQLVLDIFLCGALPRADSNDKPK